MQQIPQELLNQAIPLNRAGGESYDQGQQMSMRQAMEIASQYGHVPARISSGSVDTNSSNPLDEINGVWGVPTAQGWVPVEALAQWGQAAQQQQAAPPSAGSNPDYPYAGGNPLGAPQQRPQNSASPLPAQGPVAAAQGAASWGNAPTVSGPQQSAQQPAGQQQMGPMPNPNGRQEWHNSPQYQSQGSFGQGQQSITITVGGQQPQQTPAYQNNQLPSIEQVFSMGGTGGAMPQTGVPSMPPQLYPSWLPPGFGGPSSGQQQGPKVWDQVIPDFQGPTPSQPQGPPNRLGVPMFGGTAPQQQPGTQVYSGPGASAVYPGDALSAMSNRDYGYAPAAKWREWR